MNCVRAGAWYAEYLLSVGQQSPLRRETLELADKRVWHTRIVATSHDTLVGRIHRGPQSVWRPLRPAAISL